MLGMAEGIARGINVRVGSHPLWERLSKLRNTSGRSMKMDEILDLDPRLKWTLSS